MLPFSCFRIFAFCPLQTSEMQNMNVKIVRIRLIVSIFFAKIKNSYNFHKFNPAKNEIMAKIGIRTSSA